MPGVRLFGGKRLRAVVLRSTLEYRVLLLDVDLSAPREPALTAMLAARVAQPSHDCLDRMNLADRHWLVANIMLCDGIKLVETSEVCSRCSEVLELRLDLAKAVRLAEPALKKGVEGLQLRLPTPLDLEQAHSSDDLLTACAGGRAVDVVEAEQTLRDADPLGTIVLNADCFACGQKVRVELDLAGRWLAAARRTARELLEEIHALASHYHWTESEILMLSGSRRRLYIEMCRAEYDTESLEQHVYV